MYSIESFKLKYQADERSPKKPLTNPHAVVSAINGIIDTLDGGQSIEHFGAYFLNIQNESIGFKIFNSGTIDQVAVYPRMIIHSALMIGASGVILIHNHPSGHIEPSEEDKRLTRTIKEAGQLFDIRVVDHLIIGNGKYYSMIERGLL